MKYSYLSFIISILLGGVITGNILGDMKNKSAELVFFVWKGIQVFRKRVIPSNPKSLKQTAQRLRFSQMEKIGLNMLNTIINIYWKRFAIKKSEINAFMSRNLKGVKTPINPLNVVIIDGQAPCGVPHTSTLTDTTVTIAALGSGYIDDTDFVNACGVFFNVVTGEVGVCQKHMTTLNTAITFANPLTNVSWTEEEWGFAFWCERDTIVDAHDFTNSTTFAP